MVWHVPWCCSMPNGPKIIVGYKLKISEKSVCHFIVPITVPKIYSDMSFSRRHYNCLKDLSHKFRITETKLDIIQTN